MPASERGERWVLLDTSDETYLGEEDWEPDQRDARVFSSREKAMAEWEEHYGWEHLVPRRLLTRAESGRKRAAEELRKLAARWREAGKGWDAASLEAEADALWPARRAR